MADVLPPSETSAPLVYRPISGFALAGFALSCLFAGLVLVTTTIALTQGLPVFLPGWALVIAGAGALVSLLGQMRIRRSEGIVAGTALATWGLWLSVLLGATYFVYTWVTGLALAKQATDFLMVKSDDDSGFFPRLQNAGRERTDLYQAFLLTLPTSSRGGSRASSEEAMLAQYDQPGNDGEAGNITVFTRRPLVMALMKNPDTQIDPLGVVEWNYDGNSYHVFRNFRLTSREWVIETVVPVQSSEGTAEGEPRKWFANIAKIPKLNSITQTAYGKNIWVVRFKSKQFMEKWRDQLGQGKPVSQYKPGDTDWARILPKKEPQREHVKKMLDEIFSAQRRAPLQMTIMTDDLFVDSKEVSGRIEVFHPMRMILPAADGFPNFNVQLEIAVVSKQPVELSEAAKSPIDWEITSIRVLRAAPAPKVKGAV